MRAPVIASETEFNLLMRGALLDQGHHNLHIREANVPGVSDLIIYTAADFWVELKVDDEEVRPSQREFSRTLWDRHRNSFFLRLNRKTREITIYDGRENPLTTVTSDVSATDWVQAFRKVQERNLVKRTNRRSK